LTILNVNSLIFAVMQ